jgi:hypothetical protein
MAKLSNFKAQKLTTPSEEIIFDANKENIVYDKLNRKLTVKLPSFLVEMRLIKAVGDEYSNQLFFTRALLCASVTSVDNIPVGKIETKQQLEALFSQLGREGYEAVEKFTIENMGNGNKREDEAKEEIKKSAKAKD